MDARLSLRHPITCAISFDSQYKPTDHRSRVLRHTNGLNLSNSCVSVAFLFLISRSSADQSTFVRYPSEDYRRYSVDNYLIFLPPTTKIQMLFSLHPDIARNKHLNINCMGYIASIIIIRSHSLQIMNEPSSHLTRVALHLTSLLSTKIIIS